MTIKEYCASCKNKGSYRCGNCLGKYYDGVLQGAPTKYIKKPQTNADRIRAMSDEELVDRLFDCFIEQCCRNDPECEAMLDTDEGIPEERCKSCVREWLKQHAEE